mmetsp:Transcript_2631/g.6249  ORF Transcript_2631/g.6249 Transcript_2631/m.6249 type:complete len:255 (-) Transcript_2631:7379-8143(-)
MPPRMRPRPPRGRARRSTTSRFVLSAGMRRMLFSSWTLPVWKLRTLTSAPASLSTLCSSVRTTSLERSMLCGCHLRISRRFAVPSVPSSRLSPSVSILGHSRRCTSTSTRSLTRATCKPTLNLSRSRISRGSRSRRLRSNCLMRRATLFLSFRISRTQMRSPRRTWISLIWRFLSSRSRPPATISTIMTSWVTLCLWSTTWLPGARMAAWSLRRRFLSSTMRTSRTRSPSTPSSRPRTCQPSSTGTTSCAKWLK